LEKWPQFAFHLNLLACLRTPKLHYVTHSNNFLRARGTTHQREKMEQHFLREFQLVTSEDREYIVTSEDRWQIGETESIRSSHLLAVMKNATVGRADV
jgi:hypothetical protein